MLVDDDTQELPERDLSETLRHEIRRIRCWPAVETESVLAATDRLGRLRISLSIKTERLLEPGSTPIKDVEPITLVYRSKDAVGSVAPSVWSGRADFPRDIGHINPTGRDQPASLCLARAGLQSVYDRHGVDGVIDRLVDWLHDAKTAQLMKDGWEPVPMGEEQQARGGYFHIGGFQEVALKKVAGIGWTCGTARLLADELGGKVVFLVPALDLTNDQEVQEARGRILSPSKEKLVKGHIPWVFVWSDRSQPVEQQLFRVWNTLGEVEEGLKGTGIEAQLSAAIMQTLLRLSDKPDSPGGRPVGLLLGIWRPLPISSAVFGMSSEDEARRLEIRAYLLHCEKHPQNPIDAAVAVEQLVGIQLPTREMLAFTSGFETTGAVALIGYGALGSCIADFVVRAGVPRIAAIDKDDIAPHNLARHTATVDDLYGSKVAHLDRLAGKVTFFPEEIRRDVGPGDILNLDEAEIRKGFAGYRLVIDATADERVRRHLVKIALPNGAQLVRTEIFGRGSLGVLFAAGRDNNPNLIDLYYALCARALESQPIENWLRAEAAEGAMAEELLVGMGCASATTRMPKYVVAQHAAAFMPTIMTGLTGEIPAGVGVNPLDDTGRPLGWHWFPSNEVTVIEPADAPGWQVRLSEHAAGRLTELRTAHGHVETGGYLYGGFDFVVKQVYVVEVSDVPPGTKQSASAIELGPAGRTPLERKINRRTGRRLARVGTWHSHPRSGSGMSGKDRKTMSRFRSEDEKKGVPTLLLVTSPKGLEAHLWA